MAKTLFLLLAYFRFRQMNRGWGDAGNQKNSEERRVKNPGINSGVINGQLLICSYLMNLLINRSQMAGDKSQVLVVKEQRISGLLVAIMVGLSVTMTPLLKLIPMSVLYGVFFYMGVSSITGIQFLHRLLEDFQSFIERSSPIFL